jgi:C1A family cysteine protease
LKVLKATQQDVQGTEYHLNLLVNGIENVKFVYVADLESDYHPTENIGEKPSIDDYYDVVSVEPHPCGTKTYLLSEDTDEEAEKKYGPMSNGLIPPKELDEVLDYELTEEEVRSLPASYDQREDLKTLYGDKPVASQVLHQGSCGSCWAFAAATAMGYSMMVQSTGQFNAVPSTQLGGSCGSDKEGMCRGGWYKQFLKAMNKHDIPANWAVPYTGKQGQCVGGTQSMFYKSSNPPAGSGSKCECARGPSSCKSWGCYLKAECPGAKPHNGKWYSKSPCGGGGSLMQTVKGEKNMMHQLKTFGAIWLAIDAGPSCFKRYRSGVADCGKGGRLTHAVVGVGWGSENGKKYWLVQNSWGAGWGDNGFIKLARGVDTLGIERNGAKSGFIAPTKLKCSGKKRCANGGSFKADCTCKCGKG